MVPANLGNYGGGMGCEEENPVNCSHKSRKEVQTVIDGYFAIITATNNAAKDVNEKTLLPV